MATLQFTPFTSQVSPQLWHQLSKLKIDVLKLSKDSISLDATYGAGRTIVDRETGKDIALGCTLNASGDGFSKDTFTPAANVAVASGTVFNFNTIEEFKDANKKALFAQIADKIWASFDTDSPQLSSFLLITFADLKKYKFFYWFAFPAFVPADPWVAEGQGLVSAESVLGSQKLEDIAAVVPTHPQAFLIREIGGKLETAPITQYATFFKDTPEQSRTVAFLDPSSDPQSPGWPLLNILAYLFHTQPNARKHQVLCWRDTVIPEAGHWRSRWATICANEKTLSGTRPSAVGWERNAQGKLSPRMADLGSSMDPLQLADQALGLNLKLMRWRILPALDLERVADTKCLLLGAGTLGCYVARTLMAWGVKKISLVDSSKVSFSNPVRQPLFEFEDCLDGGRPKAECAAERLKKIYPGIDANGYSMFIPMPGHPIAKESLEQTKRDVAQLERLIDEHDVVFLLMDSRESRWLPSIVAASKNKVRPYRAAWSVRVLWNVIKLKWVEQIVMNAALGFDTFVVMRHGARATSYPAGHAGVKLGCYYCNDVVAPTDVRDFSFPLLLGKFCPSDDGASPSDPVPDRPHPRPNVYSDSTRPGIHRLFDMRGAPGIDAPTSRWVIQAYEAQGFPLLLRVFNEEGFLEQLTGLDKLQEESQAALDEIEGLNSDEDDF
ncbi:Ubiquitin-like modifier-activating enzyme ATG7 AltName: Full=ATG12-activating enzyme E1 ATG7; AltName: Full=Autophagy-related protein 7 [Serendipita indica DSM 11827]|nr:Ubiquitin-like modifier-activating enzyme ATG7 AltName: Full=ATG12-activating enzyme E1 ATG7; AltName: Full=Autophagy-related protein 7 [Serendipita indica DSM 11827]